MRKLSILAMCLCGVITVTACQSNNNEKPVESNEQPSASVGELPASSSSKVESNGYIYSKKQEIVQQLANTFTYDSQSGMLQFIIPEQLPEQYKLYIHVSGRLKMADGAMSFHAFEEESENYLWELGKTYTYEVGENALLDGLVVIGLIEDNSSELQYETSVEIDENGNITIIDS